MKRTASIMAAFILVLTGCASVDVDKENATIPAETTVSVDNSQVPITGQKSETTGTISATDGEGVSAEKGGGDVSVPLDFESLTEPPALVVSTLNNTDRVTASCSNSEWSCTLPDGETASVVACGPHPLDQQDHPIVYTAFPAGSLPSSENGEDLGAIAPIFYLDFGDISPETISAIRWPASYIGNTQNHTDFENVTIEIEEGTIMLAPLGDGDYVYEVSARWGEVGSASYVFRTMSQLRENQEDELIEIFDALNEIEYQPYTCDGLPEYSLTAPDGTVYAINFSEKWVWRGNCEQAELSDKLISQLKACSSLIISGQPTEIP